MATLNISLSEQLKSFAQSESTHAGYSNASDYVSTLIRQDKERKEAQQTFEKLLLQGVNSLESGQAIEITPDYWQQKKERLFAQATKK